MRLSAAYMTVYNVAQSIGWLVRSSCLACICRQRRFSRRRSLTLAHAIAIARQLVVRRTLAGDAVLPLVQALVAAAALLETVHALIGITRSSLGTVLTQASARVALTAFAVKSTLVASAWSTRAAFLAWALIESMRYPYYVTRVRALETLRYTVFVFLYPLGLLTELTSLALFTRHARALLPAWPLPTLLARAPLSALGVVDVYALLEMFVAVALYLPGFVLVYTHMFVQREKHLR